MSSKARQEKILEILEKKGYVTVKHLSDGLHYSTATINRDLNELQMRKLITRTYGGAELVRSTYTPILFRAHKMRVEKRHIGRVAASFVRDGETIFIDGSTTAQCMQQYIIGKKDLTVITNNMLLAVDLSNSGIKVVCLGGEVVEAPCMLMGPETVMNASRYRVDKMFFSTGGLSCEGAMASGMYDLMLKTIAKNAGKVFYLVDRKKIDQPFTTVYGYLSEVDVVISDHEFSEEFKSKYRKTEFITVEKTVEEK